MATDKKISTLVEEQFPDFLRDDALGSKGNFIAFLEGYYEWLEETGNTLDVSKNLLNNQDIDTSAEEYFDFLTKELIPTIPKNIIGDKVQFAKYARDFYKSKGSEQSFRLLFRLIWNEDVEAFYPEKLMLRASDGKWTQETSLRILVITGDPQDFTGKYIVGQTSGARAKVDRIISTYKFGQLIHELFLDDVFSVFVDGESVIDLDNQLEGRVYADFGKLARVDVKEGGAYHQLGNKVTLEGRIFGRTARGFVESIDNASAIEFYIENGGFGYELDNNVIAINGGSGTGAAWKVTELANTIIYPYYVDRIHSFRGVRIDAFPFDTFGYANGVPALSREAEIVLFEDPLSGYFSKVDTSKYTPSANLTSSNVDTPIEVALGKINITIGSISKIETTNHGYGYITLPGTTVTNPRFLIDKTLSNIIANFPPGWSGPQYEGILGRNADIRVKNSPGAIKTVFINDGGTNYERNEIIDIINVSSYGPITQKALGLAGVGGFYEYPGKYVSTDGFLSDSPRLQDNYYYQAFSYVLSSELLKTTYRNLVNQLTHPAGTKRFDRFTATSVAETPIVFRSPETDPEFLEFSLFKEIDLSDFSTVPVQPFTNDNWEYIYTSTAKSYVLNSYTYTSDEPEGATVPVPTAMAIVNTFIIPSLVLGTGLLYSNNNNQMSDYDTLTFQDIEAEAPVGFFGTKKLLYANNGVLITEVANTIHPTAFFIEDGINFVNGYFQTLRLYGNSTVQPYILMRNITANTTNGTTALSGATFKYYANSNVSEPTIDQVKWFFDYDGTPQYPNYTIDNYWHPTY